MENPIQEETANIVRDASGNITIDKNGYITCISEDIKNNYLRLNCINLILLLSRLKPWQ